MKQEQNALIYRRKLRPYEKIRLWLSRIILWFFIILTLFPIIAIFSASMSPGTSFTQGSIFPQVWSFENYAKVLQETDFLSWVKNSLIMCTAVALIQLVLTIPAAFAFSRLRFKGRRYGLMSLLILQMFPAMMAVPAILAIAYRLGAMDNIVLLILILCGGSAYNIWLLKGYIDGIPKDLDEAAMVDGANTWQTFSKIILPLIRPMLVVIFLFAFMGIYSEFVFTSSLMKVPETQTVATGLKTFITNNFSANWTQYSAASIMASIPIVIIFLASQKFIAKGLVAGAVKG